jgi:hypothetical protein
MNSDDLLKLGKRFGENGEPLPFYGKSSVLAGNGGKRGTCLYFAG